MCGEQGHGEVDEVLLEGSPPRVRGTEIALKLDLYPVRITPACAGNSCIGNTRQSGRKDHPRVCGEQIPRYSCSYADGGSPPRVRGTAIPKTISSAYCRITPACAGNSRFWLAKILFSRDHPRVCGEQGNCFSYVQL